MISYSDAINYIHSTSWLGSRPGLSRIRELCQLLGNPQDKLPTVHIAGTNGKGSVSQMLTRILMAEGKLVGTFTSPYVYSFNERICINGIPVSDNEMAAAVEKIMPLAESMTDHPTEFEIINAVAYIIFAEHGCDTIVMEAGLGGRLDSTNVVSAPLLSVITGIGLDHTQYLGSTTAEIAKEKAGIFKAGCPAVCGLCDSSAMEVIKKSALEKGSALTFCSVERLSDISISLTGAEFSLSPYKMPFSLSLIGEYQPRNALCAVTAAEALGIGEDAIRQGLAEAVWPARFEVLQNNGPHGTVVFDGGHNPQGVLAAVNTVKKLFRGKVGLFCGVMADKDYHTMCALLSEIGEMAFCVAPDNARALNADKLRQCFADCGLRASSCSDFKAGVKAACDYCCNAGIPLLAVGSLYMYRDFRDALEEL